MIGYRRATFLSGDLYSHQLHLDVRRFMVRRFSNFLRYCRPIRKTSREHSNDLLRERGLEIGPQASVVAGAGPDIVAKKAGRIYIVEVKANGARLEKRRRSNPSP